MKIFISTQLFPTESEEKVLANLSFLFPEVTFSISGSAIKGEARDLPFFRMKIAENHVERTFQKVFEASWEEGTTILMLNKQSRRPNIYEDHSLGPIVLKIDCAFDEIRRLVNGS